MNKPVIDMSERQRKRLEFVVGAFNLLGVEAKIISASKETNEECIELTRSGVSIVICAVACLNGDGGILSVKEVRA